MNLCHIENLKIRYTTSVNPISPPIDFDIESGEKVALLGRSGSGKTTLSLYLRGIIPHFIPAHVEGETKVLGGKLSKANLPEISKNVGFLLQNYEGQFFGRTVAEEFKISGIDPDHLGSEAREVIESLGISSLIGRKTTTLSSGEKQKVLLAIQFIKNKTLYILDEPFSNLDSNSIESANQIIEQKRKEGKGFLIALNHLKNLSKPDRMFVLRRDNNYCIKSGSDESGKMESLTKLGIRANGIPRITKKSSFYGLRPVVSISGLKVTFGADRILKGVDLDLYPGIVTVLLGENGAGKTTLAKAIAGFIKPEKGKIVFEGKEIKGPHSQIKMLLQKSTPAALS